MFLYRAKPIRPISIEDGSVTKGTWAEMASAAVREPSNGKGWRMTSVVCDDERDEVLARRSDAAGSGVVQFGILLRQNQVNSMKEQVDLEKEDGCMNLTI